MEVAWEELLECAPGARMRVEFKTVRGKVVDYSVVLLLATDDGVQTIRVYDSAHGYNEMHRYTRSGGKQVGVEFLPGATLGEGMRVAMEWIKGGCLEMIEGWRWT